MDSSTIVHDVEFLVKSLLAQFIPVLVCMVTIDGSTCLTKVFDASTIMTYTMGGVNGRNFLFERKR